MTTSRVPIDLPVGLDEWENIYIIEDLIFSPGNLYHGIRGLVLRPISQEVYQYRTSTEGLCDCLRDSWQEAVNNGSTILGLEDWVKEAYEEEGDLAAFHSLGRKYWSALRCYFPEGQYPVFESIDSGPLFFGNNPNISIVLTDVWNEALYELIRRWLPAT